MDGNDVSDLYFSTGNSKVDGILSSFIQECEDAIPGRVKAYYLTGSYAYGSPVSTSDIDLNVILRSEGGRIEGDQPNDLGMLAFRTGPTSEEEQQVRQIVAVQNKTSPIELGAAVRTEADIRRRFAPSMVETNAFLQGEDVLAELFATHPVEYDFSPRGRMHIAYGNLCAIHGASEVLRLPLHFPRPDEKFYGYVQQEPGMCGQSRMRMDRFFNCIFFPVSTALIALKGGS